MSKKCYRYYGGLLVSQANWLNKMAEKGYRLIRTGKILYEFEECTPGQYQYCVEFIGQKSKESATGTCPPMIVFNPSPVTLYSLYSAHP